MAGYGAGLLWGSEVGAIVSTAVAVVVAVVVAGGLEKLDRAHNWSGFHQAPPILPDSAEVIETISADEANEWWKEQGYKNPPYKTGTKVNVIELTDGGKFVRVYDGNVSNMHGGWLMSADDIAGLTPLQIQEKFALPALPKYICDVVLPPGTVVRQGVANNVSSWGAGGGSQFDLMMQRIGEFLNERLLV